MKNVDLSSLKWSEEGELSAQDTWSLVTKLTKTEGQNHASALLHLSSKHSHAKKSRLNTESTNNTNDSWKKDLKPMDGHSIKKRGTGFHLNNKNKITILNWKTKINALYVNLTAIINLAFNILYLNCDLTTLHWYLKPLINRQTVWHYLVILHDIKNKITSKF